MSSMANGAEDQGEKRGPNEMLADLENPAKRQRVDQGPPMQHGQADEQVDAMDHVTANDDAKEIKMLLQMEAAKKSRPPKPSPTSGKQSMRCQVCIRAKKGGCGTERAVYRCLRRPGGPRAASLLICGDQKGDAAGARRKAVKKDGDDGTWLEMNARVIARYGGQWHPGSIRRVYRSKRTPYGVKLDSDKENTLLLWVTKNAVVREGMQVADASFMQGEEQAYKEDESQSTEEEPMSGKRMPQLAATPPLLDMMQHVHPGMASKFHAVVRDAATGGVKLCRKCNQPALPGNYGFCAMHRTPRSRGSGKHESGGAAGGMGAGGAPLRSAVLPPQMPFTANMPSILQRALQAQAIGNPVATGTASAAGSPFAVPSMATMGSIAPPLLPGVPTFFPTQSAEATPVTATASTAPTGQGLTAGMMMMPNMGRGAQQDIPIVYGSVEGFSLPQNLPGGTATPVVAEAEAEVVATPADGGEMKDVGDQKAVEIPQATVASDVVPEATNSGEKAPYPADLYATMMNFKPANP
uniref:Uncharacterized protein n=2 Tax=Lotharella globosa TaxID=91324 RepID=A0A7S4DM75_9EUKA